jgi:cell division inhibitor SepF
MWRRAMLYLGLGPDEEYEDYEEAQPEAPPAEPARVGGAPRGAPQQAEAPAVRALPSKPPGESAAAKPRGAVVRPVPATGSPKPHVVAPTSFNHAQEVADKIRQNQPVIMNLQGVDRDLSRRLIDFASGLCYGLGGHMEKVATQVYLLTPSNVEVSAEDRRRLEERGYDA